MRRLNAFGHAAIAEFCGRFKVACREIEIWER
jgi:hypothetical protein